MKKIIFISGVHGVGKGYILKKISEDFSFPCYSASSLIKSFNNHCDENKVVANVSENQNLLLSSINHNVKEKIFVLDGHSVLINSSNEFEKVDLNIFKDLNLCAIVNIYDEPSKIVERLKSRDNKIYEEKYIEDFQNEELSYSLNLSKEFEIPYLKFKNGNDLLELTEFIKEWFDESNEIYFN